MMNIKNKLSNRPLVLIGLMGAGKTTIGKKIAELFSIPFVDSDKEIETTSGCSIADIFEQYGEDEFRRLESQVIQRLIERSPLILATGGGAFMHPQTRQLLKEKTTTVWLHCDLETLYNRVSKNTNRPLLNVQNKKAILALLIEKRYPIYAEADLIVECQDKDIETTVQFVTAAIEKSKNMNILPIQLSNSPYNVFIGENLLQQSGTLILPLLKQKKVYILADQTVANFYLDQLKHSLDLVHIEYDIILIPSGEQSKSFQSYEKIIQLLLEKGIERNSTIIAFGGGVTGDLTGFAAATILRGVPFIQIPTTLLSQVDSSVGGKTGINTSAGKNLVGAFYQPKAVIADTKLLDTLSQRELQAGYAEIVKAGLINDSKLFKWCEDNGQKIIDKDQATLIKAVEFACQFKANIIQKDEYEKHVTGRNLLNFGHSLGHTLEAELGYDGRLLHGEAVALGCCLMFKLCTQMGICPESDTQRVINHFKSIHLPVSIQELPQQIKVSNLLEHLKHDKKSQNHQITFILVKGIGKAFTSQKVSQEQLYRLLIQDGCIQD